MEYLYVALFKVMIAGTALLVIGLTAHHGDTLTYVPVSPSASAVSSSQ